MEAVAFCLVILQFDIWVSRGGETLPCKYRNGFLPSCGKSHLESNKAYSYLALGEVCVCVLMRWAATGFLPNS